METSTSCRRGGGEPHGYTEFIATVDVLVIGRNTFDKVLTFDRWPYDDMRVVVLSNRAVDTSAIRGGRVERMAGPPREIVSRLTAGGAQHAYIDGGITVQQFLRAGLIQRLGHHASPRARRRRDPAIRIIAA